jgi:sortase (surface protein transpeptidase)
MSTYHTGPDRTPARRAVPILISLGLLLVIGWLLVGIDRQAHQQAQPGSRAAGWPGPSTLAIPSIGVRAPIVGVGLRADGAMQTPDPGQVGWYRHGPKPGAPGPAVLVGHVDTRTGPDVFYRLRELRPGDEILVGRPDGTTARFLVGRLERHPKTALPTSQIWTPTSRRQLWLITCAGIWDDATGHYRDNLIVYASPTGN